MERILFWETYCIFSAFYSLLGFFPFVYCCNFSGCFFVVFPIIIVLICFYSRLYFFVIALLFSCCWLLSHYSHCIFHHFSRCLPSSLLFTLFITLYLLLPFLNILLLQCQLEFQIYNSFSLTSLAMC